MVKQIKKTLSRSRQKQLAVVMALVNGLNSAAPLVLPLAAIDDAAPVARRGDIERELANSFNRGGQLLDYLFFSTAYAEVINDGATKNVEPANSNSPADGDTINSGGTQNVNNGGSATNTTVNGGIQNVNNGGIVSGTIINSGIQNVHSGTAIDTTISGGTQTVYGSATGTTIHGGGKQIVYASGTAANLNVYGTQTVYGTTSGSMIMTGGTQTVHTGGTAANGSIQSGGRQHISGGSVTGATISGGGKQDVYAGGSAAGTIINGTISVSGEQHVRGSDTASGIALSTTINGNGYQKVHAYGIAVNTTINQDGRQDVIEGGTAGDTVINDGGRQNVFGDGTASDTMINSGGRQDVNSKGSATTTTINGGGWQIVSAGGSVSGTIINGLTPTGVPPVLGTQELYGADNGAVINNGGQQLVENGSIATGATVNSGGQQVVNAGGDIADIGGIANGTTINSGGKQIAYGGIVSGTIINGGEQEVGVHAKASGTIVNAGSQQIVSSGGTANGTVVNVNGFQIVKSSGTANDTTINHFGNQTVSAGSTVTGAAVYGEQILYGGTVSGTTIHSGGWQNVWSGAIVTDDVIDGGKVILVNDGATLGGSTILKSGNIQAGLFNNVSYTIDDLTVTGGKIILNNITLPQNTKTADRKLTIGKLTGAANFVIATDLANSKADHITITSGGQAQHTLQVAYDPLYETGDTIDGVSVPFAAVPGSGTGFTAVATEHGAYRYTPSLAANQEGTVWSITGLGLSDPGSLDPGSPEASETAYTASDTATGSLMIWRQENNSLIRRMGELRNNPGQSGDWVRVYKGEQEIANSGNRSTTQRYTAIQGGHDSKADWGGRIWRAGYVVGYLDSNLSLARGSGDASSLSVGGYAAWLGDKGHFLDLIIKQGRLKTSYDSYLNDPGNTKVSGSYRNWGTSLSAEYGYRKQLPGNWYMEPQAEINLARIGSASYTASDGTAIRHDSYNSVIGRLGLAAGRLTGSGTFYAKASLVKEFNANARVTVASGGHAPVTLEQNLKENWLELAVGVTGTLSDKTDGYLEISRTTGDKVKTPWQVNLGARWNF